MTTRINPPPFNKGKNCERVRQELTAWKEITDLSKDKTCIAIALSLPKDNESQIREKVLDQIPVDDLKSDEKFTVLLNFVDQHLAKDDLTDSLEKFEDFEDFKRADGQSNEYVSQNTGKSKSIKTTLLAEIFAFKLLRKANITKEEKLLVLTGMKYDNKDTLYEEAKKSLKKFKDSDSESCNNGSSIKMEPAFLAANEEALLISGYTRTRGYSQGVAETEEKPGGMGGMGGQEEEQQE